MKKMIFLIVMMLLCGTFVVAATSRFRFNDPSTYIGYEEPYIENDHFGMFFWTICPDKEQGAMLGYEDCKVKVIFKDGLIEGPEDQLSKVILGIEIRGRGFCCPLEPFWVSVLFISPSGMDAKKVNVGPWSERQEDVPPFDKEKEYEWNVNRLVSRDDTGIGYVELYLRNIKVKLHLGYKNDGQQVKFSKIYAYDEWLTENCTRQQATRGAELDEWFANRKREMTKKGLDEWGDPLKGTLPSEGPRTGPEIPVYGQEKFQVPNCYLEIANETAEHWDVLVGGEKIGVLNPHSTMRYSCSCIAINVELHSNFPNFRTMHKAFYPNERRGNVYYWRLSYRN